MTKLLIPEACEYCQLLEREHNPPNWIVTLDASVVFLYQDQFYKGRTVVIFKKHITDLLYLPYEESRVFYEEMLRVARAVRVVVKPSRINYALLGNDIPHLHWHIIPRTKGGHLEGDAPWPHPTHYVSADEYVKLAHDFQKVLFEAKAQ